MRRCLLFLVVLASAFAIGPPTAGIESPRVVAIGDVHGATDAFVAIMKKAGLIDDNRQWIGGNTILVQTGDMTDRGTGMKDSLDLLMSLEPQARKAGGRVHAILGNHEVMNLTGEMRDATPEIFATFGGEAAMREAFGPKGPYGKWLRTKEIYVEIDGTLFLHAGINPMYTKDSLGAINRRVKDDIRRWDAGVRWLEDRKLVDRSPSLTAAVEAARNEIVKLNAALKAGKTPDDAAEIADLLLPVANIGDSSLFHENGPLWFRGFSTWTDAEGAQPIAALLKQNRGRRVVTGHTPQQDGRIRERFGGTLFLIDTGMLDGSFYPGGRPSALVLHGGSTSPLYLQ